MLFHNISIFGTLHLKLHWHSSFGRQTFSRWPVKIYDWNHVGRLVTLNFVNYYNRGNFMWNRIPRHVSFIRFSKICLWSSMEQSRLLKTVITHQWLSHKTAQIFCDFYRVKTRNFQKFFKSWTNPICPIVCPYLQTFYAEANWPPI